MIKIICSAKQYIQVCLLVADARLFRIFPALIVITTLLKHTSMTCNSVILFHCVFFLKPIISVFTFYIFHSVVKIN